MHSFGATYSIYEICNFFAHRAFVWLHRQIFNFRIVIAKHEKFQAAQIIFVFEILELQIFVKNVWEFDSGNLCYPVL